MSKIIDYLTIMFDYLLKKIEASPIKTKPFTHIEIEDFFNSEDFKNIINSNQIKFDSFNNDSHLFESLLENGYKIIEFPGCIANRKEYIDWHKKKWKNIDLNPACESFGMALRLDKKDDAFISSVSEFFSSDLFIQTISKKLGVDASVTYFDGGIQKYLDGYEISPHPDIRRKAITYMVNINPDDNSENLNHHTHYLKFKKEYEYLYSFWQNNIDIERCWVPWHWCKDIKIQNKNNSIVIFAPSNDTLHAVKADYDHLPNQRTQIYGNLWFKNIPSLRKKEWYHLDLLNDSVNSKLSPSFLEKAVSRFRKKKFSASIKDKNVIESKNKSAKYN